MFTRALLCENWSGGICVKWSEKPACLLLFLREPAAHNDAIFSRSWKLCVSEAHKWMAGSLQWSPSTPARLTFTRNPTQNFIKNIFKKMEKPKRISWHNVLSLIWKSQAKTLIKRTPISYLLLVSLVIWETGYIRTSAWEQS